MKNKIYFCAAFVLGAGAGGFGVWYYAKKKYAEIAQEEIDSVKEVFSKKTTELHDKEIVLNIAENMKGSSNVKPSIVEAAAILRQQEYVDKEKDTIPDNAPYVIAPEEFMEKEDYDHVTLTYYADRVLTDENDERIEDVEGTIGSESLNHFGEYEDDSVFVRNDARRIEYEILLDERTYTEVARSMPRPMGMYDDKE